MARLVGWAKAPGTMVEQTNGLSGRRAHASMNGRAGTRGHGATKGRCIIDHCARRLCPPYEKIEKCISRQVDRAMQNSTASSSAAFIGEAGNKARASLAIAP